MIRRYGINDGRLDGIYKNIDKLMADMMALGQIEIFNK